MPTLPVLDIQLNVLDGLLAGVGYRLIALSKGNDPAFLNLIHERKLTLQFMSDDGVSRFYEFDHGSIRQANGIANAADLTITFKDSLSGAKLLAKADTVALMSAIQDGDMRVEGDYKLILWFAQLAKHIAKVPDAYAPYIEKAKPMLGKLKPYAYQAGELARKFIGNIKHKTNS